MACGQKSTARRRFLGQCPRLRWFEAFGQTRWAVKVCHFKQRKRGTVNAGVSLSSLALRVSIETASGTADDADETRSMLSSNAVSLSAAICALFRNATRGGQKPCLIQWLCHYVSNFLLNKQVVAGEQCKKTQRKKLREVGVHTTFVVEKRGFRFFQDF